MSLNKKVKKIINIPLVNKLNNTGQNLKELKLKLSNHLSESEILKSILNYYNDLNASIINDYNPTEGINAKEFIENKTKEVKEYLKNLENEDERLDQSLDIMKDSIINCLEDDKEYKNLEDQIFIISNKFSAAIKLEKN